MFLLNESAVGWLYHPWGSKVKGEFQQGWLLPLYVTEGKATLDQGVRLVPGVRTSLGKVDPRNGQWFMGGPNKVCGEGWTSGCNSCWKAVPVR